MISEKIKESESMSSLKLWFVFFLMGLCLSLTYGLNGAVAAESASTQPIGNLQVGDMVVDTSWSWEYRLGPNADDGVPYSGKGITRPVNWIVVAKDHYGKDSGVTLLSEEIIGRHIFDNSGDRGHTYWGSNHWGDSGSTNAAYGLRKFLNGSSYGYTFGYKDKYNGDPAARGDNNDYNVSFYDAFLPEFQKGILKTYVPCIANNYFSTPYKGEEYSTLDSVFLPSAVELGLDDADKHRAEKVWPYFDGAANKDRIAVEANGEPRWYWTRSPHAINAGRVRNVNHDGALCFYGAHRAHGGVRPALTLSSDFLISKKPNPRGAFEIQHGFELQDPSDDPDPDVPTDPDLDDPTEPDDPPDEPKPSDPSEFTDGDVNGDGVICVQDAIAVLRHIVGIEILPVEAQNRARMCEENTGDELCVQDAIQILRHIVGLI